MAAYGRLDVYWPDGPIESFQLNKPVIAIGRSTGNDVVLDTTAVSRYHVNLSLEGDKVILKDLDAVNGTYIDGVRLPANSTRQLKGGEEIQIGDVRLIFQPLDSATPDQESMPTPPRGIPAMNPDGSPHNKSETATLPMIPTTGEVPSFTMHIDALDQTVTPGAHNQTVIDIQNVSDEVDSYTLGIDGVPKEWIRLDRVEMEMAPGVHSQVVMSFKPLRSSSSKPGDYPFTVSVTSRTHPTQKVQATGTLHVLNFSGFGIGLGTPRIQAGAAFDLHLHNQGNAPLLMSLTGTDPDHLFTFSLQPDNVTLAAGERRTVRGTLRPKRQRWLGAAREHRFDIIARAKDASGFQAPVSGTYVEKPGVPLWLPALLLGIGAVLVVVLVGGALVVLPTLQQTPTFTPSPAPTITATLYIVPPTAIPTVIPTATPSPTPLPTDTATPSQTPTSTATDTAVPVPASTVPVF